LGLALWTLLTRPNSQQQVDPVVAKFWGSFSSDGQGPLVVYSNARFAREPKSNIHSYDARFDPPDSVLDHFTGVGEVLAIHELDQVFIPLGVPIHITRGALLSLDDAKSRDVILVGRPAEGPSVNDLVALRYFEFQDITEGPHQGDLAVRDLHPQDKEHELYLKSPELPITDDYAIVARVPGLNKDHKILLAAGTTTIGTEAAVEYLCHVDTLRVLVDKLGPQTPDQNFEAVLYLKIARGIPVKTELIAIRNYSSGEN